MPEISLTISVTRAAQDGQSLEAPFGVVGALHRVMREAIRVVGLASDLLARRVQFRHRRRDGADGLRGRRPRLRSPATRRPAFRR